MDTIARQLHTATNAFHPSSCETGKPKIVDFCAAPGGFLQAALALNPEARGQAYSLPVKDRGHKMLLKRSENVSIKFLDITMLCEDMGIVKEDIPATHPDRENFLPREFVGKKGDEDRPSFDIAICDGMVLRTHSRAAYRERREATRLLVTQIALGVENIKPGGSMILLLHKPEIYDTMQLLFTFCQFSDVQLFKQKPAHATRSSFYAVVKHIRSEGPEASAAVEYWKKAYRVATLGTDKEYEALRQVDMSKVEELLDTFGPTLIEMARPIWGIQANALSKAKWVRE